MSEPTNLPWLGAFLADQATAGQGGQVVRMIAGGTLLTGDCVYISGVETVNKSATAATVGAAFIGVVVGGDNFPGKDYNQIIDTRNGMTTPVGIQAATVGQTVLVQISGIALVPNQGGVTAGDRLIGGSVAGSVATGTTAGIMLGNALTTAADTVTTKMLIAHR